jgi:hypothetical protein
VSKVLTDKGTGLSPTAISAEVKQRFNIDLGSNTAKSYKRDFLRKQAEARGERPARKAAPGKPAAAPRSQPPAKPAATKASAAVAKVRKKPAPVKKAARPATHKPAARKTSAPAPKAAPAPAAPGVGAAGFNLADIQTARELLGRLGTARLLRLLDVLAR